MIGSTQRYSGGAILLHWLIALLLAGEVALGFAMPRDASGFELFQLHKSIGITILLLSILRLVWRLTHKRPPKIEGGFTGFLGSAVHAGFYVVMIVVPLSGWAIVSTSDLDIPTLIFGLVPWPHLPLPDAMNGLFEDTHEILAKVGIGLFVLHILGALRHHFLMKDALLSRMGPGGSGMAALALMLALIGLGFGVLFGLGGEHENENERVEEIAEESGLPASGAQRDGRVPLEAEPGEEGDGPSEGELPEDGTFEEQGAEGEPDIDATDTVDEGSEAAQESVAAAGPPPAWTIQPGGSLTFTVAEDSGPVNGSFKRWSGTIVMDPENPASAQIAITIQLASATVNDATRDAMLVGADFFAATANPTATWRANSVRRLGGNRYQADGTLSLKGVSRPQQITFTLAGSGASRTVSGSATIDRTAFAVGVGSNASTLGPQVSLNFAIDATH